MPGSRVRRTAGATRSTEDQLRAAEEAARAAYARLECDPDNVEYRVEWYEARRCEAAAAARLTARMDEGPR